jgi:hypothetical protein
VIRLAKSKSRKNLWVFLLLGLVLAGTIYAVGKDQGWFAAEIPAAPTPTTYTFKFYNSTGDVLDGNDGRSEALGYLYAYEYENDTFDQDDYDDLAYSDFVLDKEDVEHNDVVTPDAETLYIMLINCTGYTNVWIVPVLGENIVTLRATPTNISLSMVDIYGSNTENQTNTAFWYGSIFCVDVDGEINNGVGYDLVYDFTVITEMSKLEDSLMCPVLVIDCNGTGIEKSDVEISGLAVKEIQINSDKIEIYLNQPIYGKMDFSLEFDASDLGVDFEIESMYLARGLVGGSLTTLATA